MTLNTKKTLFLHLAFKTITCINVKTQVCALIVNVSLFLS